MNQIDNIMKLADEYAAASIETALSRTGDLMEFVVAEKAKKQALRAAIEQALTPGEPVANKVLHYYYAALAGDMTRKEMEAAVHKLLGQPQQPLFGDLIAQHPGLSEELAEMQAPNQEPVACKTLCDLCVKRGYESCANVAKITAIPAAPQPQQSEAEALAELGWQAIECSVCGSSARAFPHPQREWVRLTNEEVQDFLGAAWSQWITPAHFIRAIEAKLKEKNTWN